MTVLMRASVNSVSSRPPLVSTLAAMILSAAVLAAARVSPSRGSAMLKVFFAPSLLVKMSSKVFFHGVCSFFVGFRPTLFFCVFSGLLL